MTPERAAAPAMALTGLFIAAAIVIDLALAVAASWQSLPAPPNILLLGSALGQLALIGAWLAMGGDHPLARIVVAIAIALSLAGILSAGTDISWPQWMGIASVVVALVALPLSLLRQRGYEWRTPGTEAPPPGDARWQFSLGALVGLVTVIALALAVFRHSMFPWQDSLIASAFVTAVVAAAHLTIWAAAGETSPWLRTIAVLVGAPLLGAGFGALEPRHSDMIVVMATAILAQSGWIYAGVLVQRIGGHRLVRTSRR